MVKSHIIITGTYKKYFNNKLNLIYSSLNLILLVAIFFINDDNWEYLICIFVKILIEKSSSKMSKKINK